MKVLLRSTLAAAVSLTLALSLAGGAQANSKYAAFVMHADSGDVLFDRYSHQTRYPASLTKMMTLYLLFEEIEAGRLTMTSELSVSAQAAGQPPSKLGVTAGSTIDVDTAIKALIVKSSNDVAVVVAENLAGSEWRFAQKMTERARTLGMKRTTFRNASGLPNSKQVSTARDLATLSQRLIHDFPQYYHLFSTESFSWGGKTYRSHNAVARTYEGAEGLKTGYTRISGFNLATSASRDGNRLVGIVLGGRSVRTRDAHMREILDNAYAELKRKPALISALHRQTPSPRLKPTLMAQLERQHAAPTLAGNEDLRSELIVAAASFNSGAESTDDIIGSLIAASAADPHDLNEFERARLASLSPFEGAIGEGDAESFSPGWSVQIGAYSSKMLAQKELENAASSSGLEYLARAVQPLPGGDGTSLYRARFTALSASEAASVCSALRNRKVSCFVVSDASAE